MTGFQTHSALRFFVDAMLGKLARWLRMLGYDTAYKRDIEDSVLIERVLEENRWLLTRDGYLSKRKILRGRHTLIRSDFLQDQLAQLHRELDVDLMVRETTIPRCPECNELLQGTDVEKVRNYVPEYVARTHTEFAWCSQCNRIFWPGSHWKRFLQRLEQIPNS